MCHLFWNSSSLLWCSISSSCDFELPWDIPCCLSVWHCSVSMSVTVSLVQMPLVFRVLCFTWMDTYTGFLLCSAVVVSVVSPFEQTEMSSHSCEQMVSLPKNKEVLVILLVMYFWVFLPRQFFRLCWGVCSFVFKDFCMNGFKSIKAVELDMVFMNEILVFSLL